MLRLDTVGADPLLLLMASSESLFRQLAEYCDEFLVHAVDVEGKRCGIQVRLHCDHQAVSIESVY